MSLIGQANPFSSLKPVKTRGTLPPMQKSTTLREAKLSSTLRQVTTMAGMITMSHHTV